MQEPLRQIVSNAGEEGSVILAKVADGKDLTLGNADGDAYFKGDIIEEPPTDSYYLYLKNKWEPKQKPGIFKKLIARLFG